MVELEILLFRRRVNSPHGSDGVSSTSEKSLREIADTKIRVSAPACDFDGTLADGGREAHGKRDCAKILDGCG